MKDNIASESKYTCAGFDTGFIFCRGGGGGGGGEEEEEYASDST